MSRFAIRLWLALAVTAAFVTTQAQAQVPVRYVDVGSEAGLLSQSKPMGMAWAAITADYDEDGDIDIFIPTGQGTPDQLYRNRGDGSFEEIAAEAGVDSLAGNRAALWFDYDGDGDLDLVVSGDDCYADPDCTPGIDKPTVILYRNEGGQYTDVSAESGLDFTPLESTTPHMSTISAGDMDNDGYLDLLICIWGGRSRLFHNNGNGTFTDITQHSGFVPEGSTWQAWYEWQTMWCDFNGDGWQDIYVCVDFGYNRLLINQHDNTFVDVAPIAGADNKMNDMGLTLGDYDNDGDFDIYVTNAWDRHGMGEHNILLRNDSVGSTLSFVDVAAESRVDQGYWGWGAIFIDCNNNGWLDLAATNGFMGRWVDDTSRFFVNPGYEPFSFRDGSTALGFDDTYWGSSLHGFDYDRDGDMDMLQSTTVGQPLRLLECRPEDGARDNHYICLQPRQSGPNTRSIGAVVKVSAGGLDMMRLISAGTSFFSQEPAEANFGLGTADSIDTITVEWPYGGSTTWMDVDVNQVRVLIPGGTPGDFDMDAAVDWDDFSVLIGAWGACSGCEEDLNGDGVVNWTDVVILFSHWG